MPSVKLTNQSGGQNIVSGFDQFYSGYPVPLSRLTIRVDSLTSGFAYFGVGLSGVVTVRSGGVNVSGGLADGVQVSPGGSYTIPRSVMPLISGTSTPAVYAAVDAAASGFARAFFDWFSWLLVAFLGFSSFIA